MIGTFPQNPTVRRAYGAMCKRHWQESISATEQWKKTGDELYKYGYDPTYTFGYQNLPASSSYAAKVAKPCSKCCKASSSSRRNQRNRLTWKSIQPRSISISTFPTRSAAVIVRSRRMTAAW